MSRIQRKAARMQVAQMKHGIDKPSARSGSLFGWIVNKLRSKKRAS